VDKLPASHENTAMRFRIIYTSAAILMTLAASGCSNDKPAPNTAAGLNTSQGEDEAKVAADPNKGTISIDPEIAKLCNIPTAYFKYDSSNLGNDAGAALDALAKCFTTGPAKDRSMRIVGHADPRGETEYNFALGQRRAGSVEKHLFKRGVPETRIESSSRGELDADGSDVESWAKDRKVEILMAN
jgi:peptidoglycan-associated lipoprotein